MPQTCIISILAEYRRSGQPSRKHLYLTYTEEHKLGSKLLRLKVPPAFRSMNILLSVAAAVVQWDAME